MAPNRRNPIPPSALEQRAPYGQPAGGDRGKTRAGKAFALVLPRICVPGIRSAQRLSCIQPPNCRADTLHIFIIGKEGTFLITSLCIKLFSSICRMGVLFAPNKRIFSHGSYPARPFSNTAIPSRYRESQFHPCPTMHLTLNVDSRVSGGLV